MLARPLGRYVGANVSCHTWWSLVWSHSGCNSIKKCYCGNVHYNFVVKLIVNI